MEYSTLGALCAAALLAGTIDAIAGGGGLVTVPCLLYALPDPQLALGTNKGQSTWGSLSALVQFWRKGFLDPGRIPASFAAGFVGALGGAQLVLAVPRELLRAVVLVLLVTVAAFLALRRNFGLAAVEGAVPRSPARAALLAFGVGAYDGFFGPGTGTFLVMGCVALLGDPLSRATANAKVVNFASNLAALIVFALRGRVVWSVAIPMAVAQMVGGMLGARLAMRGGDRFVRKVVLAVVVALVARLAWDLQHPR